MTTLEIKRLEILLAKLEAAIKNGELVLSLSEEMVHHIECTLDIVCSILDEEEENK